MVYCVSRSCKKIISVQIIMLDIVVSALWNVQPIKMGKDAAEI